jgi:hypothetical protein
LPDFELGCNRPPEVTRAIRLSHPKLFWLLALAALLIRAGTPPGWMPVVSHDGIRIALCSGNGAVELTLGTDGKLHKQAPAPANPRDPCPFALASAHAADLPQTATFEPPVDKPVAALFAQTDKAAPALRRSIRPPARGPPILA